MKLKRFLLRYDPPGVGLEVEDDEHQLSVQHKNLPAKSEVSSAKDINGLVDALIDEESTLLTRRRHREGLIQLLSRLYEVDVTQAAEAEKDPPAEEPEESDALQGAQVVLTGLTGSQQGFNGEVGTVIKSKGEKQKYEVEVKGQVVKVKGKEHLLLASSKHTLGAGAFVAIRGLRNHTELNGCIAKVAECHEESQRYEVRALDSGQLFRVKKENVVLIEASPGVQAAAAALKEHRDAMKENRDPNETPRKRERSDREKEAERRHENDESDVFEIGSTVELVGLKTAQAYNGQQAEVLSVDRVRGRYEIRLHDGSVKTIRAENVKLLHVKSPRPKRKDKGL
ncbi:Pentatricopeptide repeat-containing protein [Durusdinium trenchii]|uniref:Chloroplastic n=1 Tax=Durusdinium trenchii TaxID=1381693 RepID=A0ABP0L057_9DINO